jgi:hypothetical protein
MFVVKHRQDVKIAEATAAEDMLSQDRFLHEPQRHMKACDPAVRVGDVCIHLVKPEVIEAVVKHQQLSLGDDVEAAVVAVTDEERPELTPAVAEIDVNETDGPNWDGIRSGPDVLLLSRALISQRRRVVS